MIKMPQKRLSMTYLIDAVDRYEKWKKLPANNYGTTDFAIQNGCSFIDNFLSFIRKDLKVSNKEKKPILLLIAGSSVQCMSWARTHNKEFKDWTFRSIMTEADLYNYRPPNVAMLLIGEYWKNEAWMTARYVDLIDRGLPVYKDYI